MDPLDDDRPEDVQDAVDSPEVAPTPAQRQLEERILALVVDPDYRPLKARGIARKLRVADETVTDVKRAVKRLIRAGRLGYDGKRLVSPAAAKTAGPAGKAPRPGAAAAGQHRVVGVYRRAQAGFGFVRPTRVSADERAPDIYISGHDAADAASGDTVAVEIVSSTGRRHLGPQGRIVEIVERQTSKFVGTYFERGGAAYVSVDGTLFSQAIYVGDPGAKSAQPGDKVVFEMVRFPSYVRDGEGVLTEVLGPHGQAGVDTLSVIREFGLPEEFPADVLEEARRQAEQFDETSLPWRLDLTGETIVTIDPVDARDFDDAISLVRREEGGWRLGVHIADVAHFVQTKTPLDREAHARATSVYLPDRVIPMLPEVISNALASLQPGKVRYTKTVFLEFDDEGLLLHKEFHNSAIKSTKRLTYEQVDAFLADREAWRRKLGPKVHELLGHMHQLAMTLRRRRFQRGALELSMREVKIDLDRDGRVSGAHVVENTESHQMIEEFMLAANEAVATHLYAGGLAFLRRIHRDPDERKLRLLTEFVNELGLQVGNLQDRFALQKLLKDVIGLPEQHAVNYALLRSLQRAVYSPDESGHYALASDCYCHFTSPIRRYPDLTVHRLLDALLTRRKPVQDADQLVVLGQHCSDQEQRAEAAERELTKLKLLYYLDERIGQRMDAIITGVESWGLFAQGIALPAEGMIPIASLRDDYYDFDRAAHTLSGRRAGNTFRLGDRLQVTVARVDLERRELEFKLVRHEARKGAAKGKKKAPKGKRPKGPRGKRK